MVHVAELNPARFEDTLINGGPSLSLDGLFMKPTTATPRRLPDGTDTFHPDHEDHLPRGILETEDEKRHHWFVGSIDQGTTSSRFLIFNGEGDPVASHQIEFENLYPQSGYVPCTPPAYVQSPLPHTAPHTIPTLDAELLHHSPELTHLSMQMART
jgi:glycerol kinase